MRMNFSGNTTAEEMFTKADALMAAGTWDEAESIIREYCDSEADLTLRLAQLEWRKECAEYALHLDWDELGEDGVKNELVSNFDMFAADWVVNEYKG